VWGNSYIQFLHVLWKLLSSQKTRSALCKTMWKKLLAKRSNKHEVIRILHIVKANCIKLKVSTFFPSLILLVTEFSTLRINKRELWLYIHAQVIKLWMKKVLYGFLPFIIMWCGPYPLHNGGEGFILNSLEAYVLFHL